MGFSLRKMLEGAAAQVNPFDGGKTYSTVQRQAPAQTPPPQQGLVQRATSTGLKVGATAFSAAMPGAMLAITAYKALDRTKPGKAVLAGGRRSAIGTAQAVSGLVDLATPGTGTNRISKGLDQQAKQIDQSVKDQRLNPVLYKGGQLGGDIATGMGAGGAAKWAGRGLVKAAPVLSKIPKAVSAVEMGVAKAVAPMASKNLGGRIVAKTVQNVANPKYQGVNALYTAQQTGKDASQGKQITRQRVATDAAIGGLAFPAAGAIAGQTARAAAAPVVNKLKNAHLIRPTGLSDSEVAHLNRFVDNRGTNGMTEDVYSKGVAAAQKAGVSTNDVSAMDRVIGDHMTFNTRQAVRKETLQNIKDRLSTPLGEGGYVKNPFVSGGAAPLAQLKQEALKYKTAEEFIPSNGLARKKHRLENEIEALNNRLSNQNDMPGAYVTGRAGISNARQKKQYASLERTIDDSKRLNKAIDELKATNDSIERQRRNALKPKVEKKQTVVADASKIKVSESDSLMLDDYGFNGDKKTQLAKYVEYLDGGGEPHKGLERINGQYSQTKNQPGVHDSLADNLPNQAGIKNQADNVFSLTQQSPESRGIIPQKPQLTDLYNQAHTEAKTANTPKGRNQGMGQGQTPPHNKLAQSEIAQTALPQNTTATLQQSGKRPLGEGGYVKVPGKGKGSSGAAEITENPQVTSFIKDYADMLKGIEESGGVSIMPDGTRQSSHSSFYSDYYRQYKRKPSMQAYIEHAREQLESGRGDQFAIQEYNRVKAEANNPELQSLLGQMPEKELTDIEKNKINADKLRREVINYKNTLTPVKKTGGEVNVPVRAIKQQGDVVTATNVNPNIKAAEKRYTMNENGDLLPDQNGAYRMFHDQDGKITGFRVGNEYFDSKTLGDLSQVNNYGSVFATMRRNIERSFGGETSAKVNNFLVDYQQSQATKLIDRQVRLKKDMQSLADNLGISFGVGRRNAKKVSAAIQDFGEGKLTKQNLVDQFGADQAGRIMDADKWFRSQYDTLLEEANKALTTHGYDPIPKRKDYYTHFSEPTLWQKFGLKMQEIKDAASPTMQDAMPTQVRGRIPNKLAGQSEYLEPNKKFNPFAQQRKGEQHTSDAFQSFERYLSPTLNNIYMTPAITRGRVLAKAVADTADLEGKDAKQAVVQIREWANRLAGKSNRLGDRQAADTNWGPNILKGLGWLQRRAGANSIVGNISTAALQPIVLAQTTGKFGVKNTLLAIAQETSTAHSKNAPIRFSQFMRRRYSDLAPVTRGKIDRAADIANMPLKVVEETSARITWNAAYNDALSKGFAGKQAVKYADINAEKTLAGRSIGERPEIFESKTLGNLTMYQLEVANYIQQVAKEMTPKQVMKTFAAAYAFNTVLQQATGRQVGFNPIDAAIDSWAEVNKDGKTPGEKATTIGQRWAGEVVDNMPLAGPTLAWAVGDKRMKEWTGKDSNVGRFGVASPVSTVINNPWMLAAPFGGSQVKKTYSGVSAVASGELKDKEGKTLVNIPQTPGNFAKGALFGKSAIPEVKAYYDNIGKKKVDQMTVPNQVNSKAAKMGGINNGQLMPNAGAESFSDSSIDVNERVKQAMTTPKAKELLALKEGERKAWSQQSAENNALYQEYSVMKKMLEARKNAPTLPAGIIDPNIIKFKQQENAFTDTGKERWYQKFDKNAEEIYGNAQKMLPQNFQALPKNNKTVSLYIKYLGDSQNTKSEIEKNDKQKEFIRSAYQSSLNKNGQDLFSSAYTIDQKLNAINNGSISEQDLKAAIELDNMLNDYGLSSQFSISKKIRSVYGYGSSSGSKSRGSGGARTSKSDSRQNFNLAQMNTSDLYKTTSAQRKRLRQLLNMAKVG